MTNFFFRGRPLDRILASRLIAWFANERKRNAVIESEIARALRKDDGHRFAAGGCSFQTVVSSVRGIYDETEDGPRDDEN